MSVIIPVLRMKERKRGENKKNLKLPQIVSGRISIQIPICLNLKLVHFSLMALGKKRMPWGEEVGNNQSGLSTSMDLAVC